MKSKFRTSLMVIPPVIILDQITKHLARERITTPIEVIEGFFNLVHVENRGGAWGIMADSPYNFPFFLIVSLVAFIILAIYFVKVGEKERTLVFSLCLIMGGAVGNFFDRIVRGSVTDFFDFFISQPDVARFLKERIGSNHWPAFNVADSAITVGVFIVLFHIIFFEKRGGRMEKEID